jgi:hypothetical protein
MIGARGEWLDRPHIRICLVVVMIAAGLVPVLSRRAEWLGSWKMALDQGTFSITLVGPVAAGIACAVYVRFRRSGVPDLLSQAGRPWVGWITPAFGVWILASLAVILICAFTTTATWAVGAHAYPELSWVVPAALIVLGAQIAIGALMGSQIPHYWAVPWAGVIVFTLYILSSVGVLPGVFRTGGVTGSLAGETFAARPIWLQALAALGIAVAAMALSWWDLFRISSLPHRVGVVVVLCGAIPALLQLPADSDLRYAPQAVVDYDCRDGRPTVCMLEETTRPLDDLAAAMQRLARPLLAAGARLPDRFTQSTHLAMDPSDGVINLDDELSAEVSVEAAARSLSVPAACPAYSSDDPDAFPEVLFAVRDVLVRWILVQDGQETPPSGDHPTADWWALPLEQQRPWVRSTYDALRDCRLFDLHLPSIPAKPR